MAGAAGRWLAVTVLLAACMTPAGCSSSDEEVAKAPPQDEPAAAPTEVEAAWVREWTRWERDYLLRGLGTALAERDRLDLDLVASNGDEVVQNSYAVALRGISECAALFAERVGDPPSDPLAEAADLTTALCEDIDEAIELDTRAVEESSGVSFQEAELIWDELPDRLAKIETAVSQAFIQGRQLPREGGVLQTSRVEPLFSKVGAEVAGGPVNVRCWSEPDWNRLVDEANVVFTRELTPNVLGFAAFGRTVNIAPGPCAILTAVAYQDKWLEGRRALIQISVSVSTLAHESVHATGVTVEAQTECYAVQLTEETAMGLGAPARYARRLAEFYAAVVYPKALPGYRTPKCRDGGPYDLNPGKERWP